MAAEVAGDTNVTTTGKGWRAGPAKALAGGDPKKQAALKQEISRNRRHVETAEKFPVFDGDQWSRGKFQRPDEPEVVPARRGVVIAGRMRPART